MLFRSPADAARFGPGSDFPAVLEIQVTDRRVRPLGVGEIVDEIYFPGSPPVIFNVCFSCAKPDLAGRSAYADPTSHWFNVFFGFYEIDVSAARWGRPFGFTEAELAPQSVCVDDLLKIGKADWNYFSNWMYGVPRRYVDRYREIGTGAAAPRATITPRLVRDGAGPPHVEGTIEGLRAVSGYPAGERLENNVCFWSPVWRRVFGTCGPRPGHEQPFPGTSMKMKFWMRFEEGHDVDLGERAYKTFLCGGSINESWPDAAFNEEFLEAQMRAVRAAAFRKRSPAAG